MPTPSSLQRKPFWAPVGLAAASALAAALVMALLAWLLVTARSTTVIVVREVEMAANGGGDRALSAAGQSRAELLARMFGDARLKEHVDAIYVSPTQGTQATARPLAERLGTKPVVVSQDDPRALARRVLREHRGGRILVVARGDAARDLAAALSGVSDIPAVLATDFGTLYIVTVPRIGRANLLSVEY
jgi:broad specificity phosphatase PhoE